MSLHLVTKVVTHCSNARAQGVAESHIDRDARDATRRANRSPTSASKRTRGMYSRMQNTTKTSDSADVPTERVLLAPCFFVTGMPVLTDYDKPMIRCRARDMTCA
eukprot:3909978-Amphidinium_carterae.2